MHSAKINLVPIDRDFFPVQYGSYFIGISEIYFFLNEKKNVYHLSLVDRIIDVTQLIKRFDWML